MDAAFAPDALSINSSVVTGAVNSRSKVRVKPDTTYDPYAPHDPYDPYDPYATHATHAPYATHAPHAPYATLRALPRYSYG